MNRLKELRQKNNLTLKELGQKVGMANNTLSQYENGKREPKIETWEKLASFFNVPTSYLMGLSNDIDGWDEWAKNTGFTVNQIKNEINRLIETNRLDKNSDIQHQIASAVSSLDHMAYTTTEGVRSELIYELTSLISKVDGAFYDFEKPEDKKRHVKFKFRDDMNKQAYDEMIDALTEAKYKIARINTI